MTGIKASSHGIVVEHKESGVRYAISDRNYDEKVHRKVRDLRAGETVLGYKPRATQSLQDAVEAQGGTTGPGDAAKSVEDEQRSVSEDAKTEGSASAGTKGK
ncbi:hypothetical protein SEA_WILLIAMSTRONG_12 [Microbacterium phage WilliamStrong]|nr:hypothetical protein SEA_WILLIAMSTRONG_12 [Microbacterium phage WilliamStrong]